MTVDVYKIPKEERWKPSLNVQYQKGYFLFNINLYFFEIYALHKADDWILSRVEEKNGKKDLIFYLNDKYKDCTEYTFTTYKFPFFFIIRGEV